MSRRREWLLVALVALLALAGGYAYNAWRTAPQASPDAEEAIASAKLPDLQGVPQTLERFRGQVVVVNFWATWCAPCREELPFFVDLQRRYGAKGLQFVGIAIDQPENVRPYAAEIGINFPVLIGSVDAIDLARRLGNRAGALPFTVIIGRDGRIAAREVGAVKPARFEPLVAGLL